MKKLLILLTLLPFIANSMDPQEPTHYCGELILVNGTTEPLDCTIVSIIDTVINDEEIQQDVYNDSTIEAREAAAFEGFIHNNCSIWGKTISLIVHHNRCDHTFQSIKPGPYRIKKNNEEFNLEKLCYRPANLQKK